MAAYKLGKIIDNQMIDIQLILQQLEAVREKLRKSLRKRKDMDIQQNDTLYQEVHTQGFLDDGNSNESDEFIANLLEKNNILNEVFEIDNIKRG